METCRDYIVIGVMSGYILYRVRGEFKGAWKLLSYAGFRVWGLIPTKKDIGQ